VRALLLDAARRLDGAGVDSPRLAAELLLARALDCDRAALLARPERSVESARAELFGEFVRRRAAREPIQHILGRTEFWSMTFLTDPRALVPRPETELLVQAALALVAQPPSAVSVVAGVAQPPPAVSAPAGVAQPSSAVSVVAGVAQPPPAVSPLSSVVRPPSSCFADLGTGAGCIALALARELPDAELFASDLSADALALAAENARLHGLDGRVRFLLGDMAAPYLAAGLAGRFDAVLSNPPYIPAGEIAGLQPEVRDHDPRAALDGGADGLDAVRRLLSETPPLLRPGGALVIEFGAGQAESVRRLAPHAGWRVERTLRDHQGIERVVQLGRTAAG
jgi:release factor glutamine methyltransferase